MVLFVCFGAEELEHEETSRHANITSEYVSIPTVFLSVLSIELISTFSYFILFRAAKKWISQFQDSLFIKHETESKKLSFSYLKLK